MQFSNDLDITPEISHSDVYSGPISEEERRKSDPSFLENTECGLSDNEKFQFIACFTAWTGLQYDDQNGDKWNYGPNGYDEDERVYGKLSSNFWLTGKVRDLERAATVYAKRVDEGYTEQEMLDELMSVKNFLKDDLNEVLGLKGRMAELNTVMFMKDLESFTEQELLDYVEMFHIDVSHVNDVLENIEENYGQLSIVSDITDNDLEKQQEMNNRMYLQALKSTILEFKIWMLDRLRLWRWREEVLLSRTGDQLPIYPGVPIICRFESATELLSFGIRSYYLRVGEIKREDLMERYHYFDLYHMAGKLSHAYSGNIRFDTNMTFEDLADFILYLIQDLAIDPRHIITPLGVYRIFNFEVNETIFNLCDTKGGNGHDICKLTLACSHAGIDINTVTEIESSLTKNKNTKPGQFVKISDPKPPNVLLEELTSQYISPQFFTGVENHRDFPAALLTLKTLSGKRITNANKSELVFYGVGDGLSKYGTYTPRELANVFSSTKSFFDPISIKDNPDNPFQWFRFSAKSIKRLLTIVIPRMRMMSHTTSHEGEILDVNPTEAEIENRVATIEETGDYFRRDLDDLEKAILDNFDVLDNEDPETIDEMIKPRGRQKVIVDFLKSKLDDFQTDKNGEVVNLGIRSSLGLLFAHLYNMGVQFSDWDNFVELSELVVHRAILNDYNYKRVNPEWSTQLSEKIFNMVTLEIEKYFNVTRVMSESENIGNLGEKINQTISEFRKSEPVSADKAAAIENYSEFLRNLRLVKFYNDAYRIDWNDELSTIQGQLARVVQANKLGLYEYIRMTGNWLMSTANYYSVLFFDTTIGVNSIDVTGEPSTIKDYKLDAEHQ